MGAKIISSIYGTVHNHGSLGINHAQSLDPSRKGLNSRFQTTRSGESSPAQYQPSHQTSPRWVRNASYSGVRGRENLRLKAVRAPAAFGQGWASDSLGNISKRHKPRPTPSSSFYRFGPKASAFCKSSSVTLVYTQGNHTQLDDT